MKRIFLCVVIALSACNNNAPVTAVPETATVSPEKQLKDAVAQYPDSLLMVENLVQYYRDNNNNVNALDEVNKAIKRDSINAKLWDMKATLLFESADTNNAIHSFEKAIGIFPDPAYIIALGTLYAQTKNAKALVMADALLTSKKDETDKQSLFIKGLYYTYMNDKIKAISFFDKCLALNYTFMDAYLEKAIALYDLEKYAEALAVLDKAVTLQNSFSEGYYYRGRCLEKLKQTDDAIDSYQRAVMYDPEYTEAKEALQKLGVK